MKKPGPIYTEKAECQDCYKCVRHCPVKAIEVRGGRANIVDELCIGCGRCVSVCPVGAKRIRTDLDVARFLLQKKEKVFVSLAPSFIGEYQGISPDILIAAIRRLGVFGVSETALGADIVSHHVVNHIQDSATTLHISSACPAVVALIEKYYTDLTASITPFNSPVLAHCKMLRQTYGDDIGVIFVGPCAAKKGEADRWPESLDVALTFGELNQWFEEEGIWLEELAVTNPEEKDAAVFIPHISQGGRFYPIDGGMNRSLECYAESEAIHTMSYSGSDTIRMVLDGLKETGEGAKIFLELLACEGGCINGPAVNKDCPVVRKEDAVDQFVVGSEPLADHTTLSVDFAPLADRVEEAEWSEDEITKALLQIGKTCRQDELNCGGCGYDSCRQFAKALLSDKAESSMCVSYTRKLAQCQANALIHAIPAGVAMVDENLQIKDCNLRFVEIVGGDMVDIYKTTGTLEGADLKRLVPFAALYETVFKTREKLETQVRLPNAVVSVTIFPVVEGHVVGSFIQDVTTPAMQREEIVKHTQDVIVKKLQTVQQIASLLGENAAESEVILNTIAESFALMPPEKEKS